jgi:DNA (cytosine-5)-methyltransferase 1
MQMKIGTNSKFTFIDLFSGIGGFRLALNNIGGECLNFSEINKDAINTYCTNFNENSELNLGDITKIKSLPSHDLLTAGVPCQSWSIAGKNLGFDDDRGQLWNDTIYLLNKIRPKAFIFENVKGLTDPRNKVALNHILKRIKDAGYFAQYFVLNSFDYGVPQSRVRVYIIGFLDENFLLNFKLPPTHLNTIRLKDILSDFEDFNDNKNEIKEIFSQDLFGNVIKNRKSNFQNDNKLNDYFLFNDIRNGHSTIHSWDLIYTTERQKYICELLLKNRRKSVYGELDGNPLSYEHFKKLDSTIALSELDELVGIDILKIVEYSFELKNSFDSELLNEEEKLIIEQFSKNKATISSLKNSRNVKVKRISVIKNIDSLKEKNIISCDEIRYEFKNTKISSGLKGINRIFLPKSEIFPTLVASDSIDFVASKNIEAGNSLDYKKKFLEEIFFKQNFRRITKEEACLIQGFPKNFILPDSRSRWMKLIGNSVSVPVIQMVGTSIIETGVFGNDLSEMTLRREKSFDTSSAINN